MKTTKPRAALNLFSNCNIIHLGNLNVLSVFERQIYKRPGTRPFCIALCFLEIRKKFEFSRRKKKKKKKKRIHSQDVYNSRGILILHRIHNKIKFKIILQVRGKVCRSTSIYRLKIKELNLSKQLIQDYILVYINVLV